MKGLLFIIKGKVLKIMFYWCVKILGVFSGLGIRKGFIYLYFRNNYTFVNIKVKFGLR